MSKASSAHKRMKLRRKRYVLSPNSHLQLELRIENERYFRQHPEISSLLGLFVRKILDDRPENILEYAGTFFDRAELRDVVEAAIV